MDTMFDRYGGFTSVSRIVSSFYDRVLDSPIMGPYFTGVDMKRQIDHQTKFIAFLMGGPASFSDDQLKAVHQRMDITEEAFNEMLELLTETLEDFDFTDADVQIVRNEIIRRKPIILKQHV